MTTALQKFSHGWAKPAPPTRSSSACPQGGPEMFWLAFLSYFFGGVFLTNAVPHFVAGLMGRPFQSPFAKPPGQGLSSSTVNVLWGFFNLVIGYLLIFQVGNFDVRDASDIIASGAGGLLIALFAASHFGRFNGGRLP